MSTDIRRTRPRFADRLRQDAGWATEQSAPRQNTLALVLGLSTSEVSRQCRGRVDGVVSRFLATVRTLVEDPATEAGPVLVEALATAEETAASLDEDEIRRRLYKALDDETHRQAAEDIAERRVLCALAKTAAKDARPADFEELHAALVEYDEANRLELARQIDALTYARALRVRRGWRAGP